MFLKDSYNLHKNVSRQFLSIKDLVIQATVAIKPVHKSQSLLSVTGNKCPHHVQTVEQSYQHTFCVPFHSAHMRKAWEAESGMSQKAPIGTPV
jgi:hypothetical protein